MKNPISVFKPVARLALTGLLLGTLAMPIPASARIIGAAMTTATGKVTAVDPATRAITLQGDNGNTVEVVAGPDVRNFQQIKPVPGALVDLWHADAKGDYDNSGFHWRGHQFADAEGRFRFRTIVPGNYPGRTRHFHVKVQPKGGRVLTTQLYFPGEPGNRKDELFRRELLIRTAKNQEIGRAHV